MLIDQFISYIEAEKRFSPLTVEAYQSDMDQFAHFLKDELDIDDLTQVKTTMVKSYIVHLKEEGLVNRSINRKTSTLRTFYKYCLRENLIEKSASSPNDTLLISVSVTNLTRVLGCFNALMPVMGDFSISSSRRHYL